MATTKKETKTEEVKTEMETVFVPKVKKDEEDLVVSVNFKDYIVKKGVPVEVPKCVAEVIRNSQRMMAEAMAYEESIQV